MSQKLLVLFQAMKRVKLKHELTTVAELYCVFSSFVLPSGDIVVFGGKMQEQYAAHKYKFYLFDMEVKPSGQTIDLPCSHVSHCFLPVPFDNTKYLCVIMY